MMKGKQDMNNRLIETGKVEIRPAVEIPYSKIGIGFEKLDRAVFEPEKAYDKIGALGVKWIRLQSGWQRTETEPGVYHFEWLDDIIDNLIARGMQPWICLCYGNQLYDDRAKTVFGAVGCPPIHTEEQKKAWAAYVTALVSRYKGRVTWFEVWNEPDGDWCWKHGASGVEYGKFVADTAKAIREGNPDAKVIGGSVCISDLNFINAALANGMGDSIDALTFHEYTPREGSVPTKVKYLTAICHAYNPKIEIIQGESGSQSRDDGAGALSGGAWTQWRQAKQCARHTMVDLLSDVKFMSFFTSVDMIEALNGTVGDKASYLDYGYFGVLGADFDENGISTGDYTPKLVYYTLGTIANLFAGDIHSADLPVVCSPAGSGRVLGSDVVPYYGGFERSDGAKAFVYWNPTDLMTTDFEGTATFQFAAMPENPKLIDLTDGRIYAIPESMVEKQSFGCYKLKNIPCCDYPLMLAFDGWLENLPKNV